MAQSDSQNQTQENTGSAQFNWTIPEYQQYTRGKRWYIGAIIVGLALLIYSVLSANLLFGLIIIIAAMTLFYLDQNEPQQIEFTITDKGLVVGNKFYDYSQIDSFYIIYEPPEIQNMFIVFNNPLTPRLNIPLQDQNPVEVRKAMKEYLPEDLDKQGEPISESISKILKL